MSLAIIGAYTLGEINVAAATSATLMPPVLAQLDLTLTGGFGLGALEADISADLDASVSTGLSLSVQVANPIQALEDALQAAILLQAQIAATLSLGLPVVSADVSVQISASAAISATLTAKLGGIRALIGAALEVKLPAVNFLGELAGSLSVGPVVLLSFSSPGDTLGSIGAALDSTFSAGLPGILLGDQVYGVVLVTKAPSAWAAMQATLRTS
jgi:hypothetical protein